MSHATHANAALTPRARLRLARLIVDHGWPPARAAERYDVSWKTAAKWVARWKQRLGPVEIGDRLAMPASTVHAVLVRCRINRLANIDRATGEPIRRYEHQRPGDLIHVDVKKPRPCPRRWRLALPRPPAGQEEPLSHCEPNDRPNSAIGKHSPITRLDNLPGHHI
jgi:hypothetical protein